MYSISATVILAMMALQAHANPVYRGARDTCPIEGQVYRECGTACPPTCSNPGPTFCTFQCVPGCQCPPGTLLDGQAGKCVNDISECSTTCSIEGQVFTECGTACPPTCAEPDPGFCTDQCVVGCQCPCGTLLDEKAGKCVKNINKCE